ncbi:MAG: SBBP repeat-containing protein [Candidatus Sulfopaludibacter sp.]|nr:SBBP repeat-containing protein [Candidatus Sulfopaludibacter sp.]
MGSGSQSRYVAHGDGYAIALDGTRASIRLPRSAGEGRALAFEFAGARKSVAVPGPELPGKVNYIYGNDPRQWKVGLPTFGKVTYNGIYPGVDAVFYGNQKQLEFDLLLRPGADPQQIRLKFSGNRHLSVDADGALVVQSAGNTLRLALPAIYQEADGRKQPVKGRYTLRADGEAGFAVEDYDRKRQLVIDPTIVYSALLGGGTGDSFGQAIAVDALGNSYVAGYTYAQDFPLAGTASLLQGTANGFVAKVDPNGNLVYSTYIGGAGTDQFLGIAVDASGSAWVTGVSSSTNFPLVSPFQSLPGGVSDGVVLKLNAQGHPIFSSYFGFSTRGNGIALDTGGNAYVAGNAGAIPVTAGAFQTSSTGSYGFLAKFSAQGALNYATYLGGPGGSYASAVAVDLFGNAYVAGYTFATSFPGAPGGGAQPFNRGSEDAFVAKVNPAGSALSYFTFLGGSGNDFANSISLDSNFNAYVAGGTTSGDFYVTDGALQTSYSLTPSPFLAKLNAGGSQLLYSTYLGSARPVYQYGLAVDAGGNAYVAGTTADSLATAAAAQNSLPNTSALFQTTNSGASWSAFDGGLGGTPAAISPDPQNEGFIVAATDLGIFRTTNNGASWTRLILGTFVGLSRSPANSSVLYASTGTQVFYSTNNGVTWSITQNRAVASAIILADPLNANTAYAVTSGQAISKTTDGGTTWTTLAGPGTFTVDSFVAAPNGTLFLDTNLGVFASADHGASWAPMNTGLAPLAGVVNGLTVSAANSLVLYRSAGTPTIYSSADGGATWAPVSGSLPYNAGALAASATNAAVVYALPLSSTTAPAVFSNPYVSSDGGATWNPAGTGLGTSAVTGIVFDPANGSIAYALAKPTRAGFLTKINSTGSAVVYFTALTGSISAQPNAIAIAPSGDVFVAGTEQGAFPGAPSVPASMSRSAFVTRIEDVAPVCSYTVQPGLQIIYGQAQTLTYVVTAPGSCGWTVSTDQPWATIGSAAASSGADIVTVNVTANTSGASRTVNLTLAGQAIPVIQAASTCSYSVNPGMGTVPVGGGTVAINVIAPDGCPWSVGNPYPSVVSFPSGSIGSGGGTVTASVAPASTAGPRNLGLPVGNTMFAIFQSGLCSYSLSNAGGPFGASGQSGAFTINTGGICPWTAVSNQLWLTVTAGGGGNGPGTVNYTIAPNATGSPRVGAITAGGQTFTVVQAAVGTCLFSITSTSVTLGNGSGTFASLPASFAVNATNCTANDTWSATSDSRRLSITSGASGSGTAVATPVALSMLTNSTTLPQVAHITVNAIMSGIPVSMIFTVSQAGSAEPEIQRAVRALYQTILGREPDPSGWAFWTGSGVGVNIMADDFYRSPEFQGSGFAVFSIYTSVLGRLPTFAEWSSVTTALRNLTISPAQLVGTLAGNVTSAAFVQTAILNGLGRSATPDEVTNYGAQLDGGETKFDFLNTVIFTDPAFQSNTNGAFVAMLYYTILVRDYDPAGFTFWLATATNPPGMGGIYYVFNDPAAAYAAKLGIIGQAVPPNPSALGFLGSPEFQGLIQ